jgi:hypothetical protein
MLPSNKLSVSLSIDKPSFFCLFAIFVEFIPKPMLVEVVIESRACRRFFGEYRK